MYMGRFLPSLVNWAGSYSRDQPALTEIPGSNQRTVHLRRPAKESTAGRSIQRLRRPAFPDLPLPARFPAASCPRDVSSFIPPRRPGSGIHASAETAARTRSAPHVTQRRRRFTFYPAAPAPTPDENFLGVRY
jgi:hypothetical protein